MEQQRTGTQLTQQDWQSYFDAIKETNPEKRETALKAYFQHLNRDGKLESFKAILEQSQTIMSSVSSSSNR